VSDHGFIRTERELQLNAAFRDAGLIQVDDKGKMKSWHAYAWASGGSAAIMLQDASDEDVRKKTRQILKCLADDPASGLGQVYEGAQALALQGFPEAAFIVGVKDGYRLNGSLEGPVTKPGSVRGTHGYLPNNRVMDSSFFLVGPDVPGHRNLGRIDMRDIAPTLAGRLGVSLPSVEGRDLIARR
jgi:hypothetical protein